MPINYTGKPTLSSVNPLQVAGVDDTVYREQFESDLPLLRLAPSQFRIYTINNISYDIT